MDVLREDARSGQSSRRMRFGWNVVNEGKMSVVVCLVPKRTRRLWKKLTETGIIADDASFVARPEIKNAKHWSVARSDNCRVERALAIQRNA